MPETADPLIGLGTYLSEDDEVQTLTDGDIVAGRLPQRIAMPKTALVIAHAGGGALTAGIWGSYTDLRFDMFAYGATPYDASRLWRAVHRSLKLLSSSAHGGVFLYWARPAGGPNALFDPDTKWPYVLSSWQVLLSEVAA